MLNQIKIIKKEVKNTTLKVKPNGEVILTTPLESSDEYISHVINKRNLWIKQKLEFFSRYQYSQKEYVSGEDFKYLGKSYRLKVIESKQEYAKLQRSYLELYVKNTANKERKQTIIYDWYYKKALLYFYNLIEKLNKTTKQEINNIQIRKMKTKWGSCNPNTKNINLNIELIKKPKICIEYVIFHELAHLIHPNHSKEFYNYLTCYMSDWQKRKELLEKPEI